MGKLLTQFTGPRITAEDLARHRFRYRLPTIIFTVARLALLISIFLPYWKMQLKAPQYPDGLEVLAYVNHLTGDVREVDTLNHYIGMRPLGEAAQLERSLSIAAIIALVFLVEGAVYVHSRWAVLLTLPAVVFPYFFLADLYFWLNHFGQNLDPAAPLSSAIKPFTPPLLGTGDLGNFQTVASAGPGLILAWAAGALVIAGLYFHRRAYKPLFESRERMPHAT